METLIKAIEVFALVTGLAYIVLEILQKDAMWWVGIATGAACAFSFAVQRLYASMGLNIYYVAVSVWGIVQWRRDRKALQAEGGGEDALHLRKPSRRTLWLSGGVLVAGTLLLSLLLQRLGDSASALDAGVTVLSAIATWWLAKSYPEQWLLWIVADLLSTVLCVRAGMYWMAVLYFAYAVSAAYGWLYWKKKGKYIEQHADL